MTSSECLAGTWWSPRLGRLGQMHVLVLMLPRPKVASEYGLCRSPEPPLIVVPSLLLEQFFWASLDLGFQAYS